MDPEDTVLLATQESRNANIAPTTLAAERANLKDEFRRSSGYSDAGFDAFAKELVTHRSSTDGGKNWEESMALAGPICCRSDVIALISYLIGAAELEMYDPFNLLAEIVMAYASHSVGEAQDVPPEPYTELLGEKWSKTAAAHEYGLTIAPDFCFIDVHHKPLLGLHMKDK